MPKKTAISFKLAIQMTERMQIEAFKVGAGGRGPGEQGWYTDNFVEWISSKGFHIELTGDEFEPFHLSSFVV